MQSVIKRPCPATRIHFQPYGQPNVERKTTTGERHPAASSRGSPSTGSHPRKGRRPRRPGNLLSPPIPGNPPRAGHARPLPRGSGQAPCRPQTPTEGSRPLPTDRPISAYVNYIRRAGCPHPAASSRGYPLTGSHPRRGRRPRRPGNLPSPPIPGKTSGPGMPGPYRAAAGKPPCRPQTPTEGSRPLPTDHPINECRPYRKFARLPVNGQPPT